MAVSHEAEEKLKVLVQGPELQGKGWGKGQVHRALGLTVGGVAPAVCSSALSFQDSGAPDLQGPACTPGLRASFLDCPFPEGSQGCS